jgi:hypothetical protein
VGIIRGTVLAGVGAALVLLSACTGGGNQAAPTITPSTGGSSGSAPAAPSNQPAVDVPAQNTPEPTRPSDVAVSIVTAIGADGTVEWLDAQFAPAETNNRTVEPTSQTKRTAKLADDAAFLSTQGCDPDHPASLELDGLGLGTVPCDREAYATMTPQWVQYAPSIFFNDQGEIVKMANHYHP